MAQSPELITDVHVTDPKNGGFLVLAAGTPKSKIPKAVLDQVGDHCFEKQAVSVQTELAAGPNQSAGAQLSEEDLAFIRQAREAEAERTAAEQEAADKAAAEAAKQGGGQA